MPFERPTLTESIARIQADIDSRLDGEPYQRRRLLAILARMEGGVAHGLYGYLDWQALQIMPDTAEMEHLERWSSIWGIPRKAATKASINSGVSFSAADGTSNKRGWWADTVAPLTDYGLGQTAADGGTTDRIGSRLWLLSREKQLPEVLARAKYYAEESLQWLLDDGRATDVAVTATNPQLGWLTLEITITLPDGSTYTDKFNYQPSTGFFIQN